MKTFFLLLSPLMLHAQLFTSLVEPLSLLSQECSTVITIQTPTLNDMCQKYISSSTQTLAKGLVLENKLNEISKEEAQDYLKALREEDKHYQQVQRKINQIILSTPNDQLALKLFNLKSYEANIYSIKNIEQRNIPLDEETRQKIKKKKEHASSIKTAQVHQRKNTRQDSFSSRLDQPYKKVKKYDDADEIKLNPSAYLNKHITLRCNADSLYVKASKKVHHYTMLNGFKCQNFTNHYKTSSFLWNVYTHQSNLKLFNTISKQDIMFTAHARLKPRNNFEQEYILIIDNVVKNYD